MSVQTWINRMIRRPTHPLPLVDTIEDLQQRHSDFDEVRREICSLGTDSLSHFGHDYTHEGGLCLQQRSDEITATCVFLRERTPFPRYLEIGSASGGVAWFFNQFLKFEKMWSLDDGQHPRAAIQEQTLAKMPHCKRFRGDSHSDAAKKFIDEMVDAPLDLAMIDGDHSYEGVKQDLELVLPHCRRDTLLIFHDIVACEGVRSLSRKSIRAGMFTPLAEFIGADFPLGIGVAAVR